MLAVALLADVTDRPVWFLFGATVGLAIATGVLAVAAIKALRQLRVALQELEEIKRDRQVMVFGDFGRRWEGREMTEALQAEIDYRPEELRALFLRAGGKPSRNPFKERRRIRESKKRVLLLRVPNYFEDAAFIWRAGGLEGELFAENFGGVAIEEWKIWGPTVKLLQEEDPLAYEEFEALATQAKKDEPGPAGG